MESIYNYTLEKLENYFLDHQEKKFKATQIFDWLYRKKVHSFEEMTNLKKDLIEKLKKEFSITSLELVQKQEDIDVKKFLFSLEDHQKIEAVLMKHNYGNSLCISTQVGCNMGCAFCESGRLKKRRNLKTCEMVLQILKVEEIINEKITHVVLMGIGEPFDNYDAVIDFINIINCGKGLDIGARHITVSTSGIIPKIEQFIEDGKQVNLAISLHAPNDTLRNELMPINKAYPLKDLIQVLKKYIAKTNRRVTFEYIMIKDKNDSLACAKELASLVQGMNCYINLIPYNETSHIQYKRSEKETILKFYDCLKKNHINVTIRKEFGTKVMAACGQLRAKIEEDV